MTVRHSGGSTIPGGKAEGGRREDDPRTCERCGGGLGKRPREVTRFCGDCLSDARRMGWLPPIQRKKQDKEDDDD